MAFSFCPYFCRKNLCPRMVEEGRSFFSIFTYLRISRDCRDCRDKHEFIDSNPSREIVPSAGSRDAKPGPLSFSICGLVLSVPSCPESQGIQSDLNLHLLQEWKKEHSKHVVVQRPVNMASQSCSTAHNVGSLSPPTPSVPLYRNGHYRLHS